MTPRFLTSQLGADPVVTEAVFKADPARVFKAWSDPEAIKGWFGRAPHTVKHATIDLRVGGTWRFTFNDAQAPVSALSGTYLEIKPARLLVFTWTHETGEEDGTVQVSTPTKVTVTFAPEGSGTRLTVVHEAICLGASRRSVADGWSYAFVNLFDLLANGNGTETPP